MEEKRHIKSYVLRASRMSSGQRYALDNYSEKHCIDYNCEILDYRKYFDEKDVCIEIGFGMGTATAAIAEKNPETGFLGVEVHSPGVGRLLLEIEEKNLSNVKIINHDAVQVLNEMIADSSISGFHILFPDPWPKQKHHKRRLINKEFTDLLVRKLKNGGYIYCATDWENYAQQILTVFNDEKRLVNKYEKWADSPVWRPKTAFENKGLKKNHVIREIYFKSVK